MVMTSNIHQFEDSDEDLFVTFQIPVLVNAGVDDPRVEDLLCLLSEEVAQVVHVVQLLVVVCVLFAEMGQ